jgi:hypothetical protein
LSYAPSYRVVVRNQGGDLRQVLLPAPQTDLPDTHVGISLDNFAGQTIVLSFEEQSSTNSWGWQPGQIRQYAIIDNVSIKDKNNNELLVNGDFSSNLTGWKTNDPQELQNMTSDSRKLEGLDVKRSFFTAPSKHWGRWVDVFSNSTGSPVSRTITYDTQLGSNGGGVIYTSTSGTTSLTSWDSRAYTSGVPGVPDGSRDIGWVFGNASSVNFISYPNIGSSDIITVTFDITVPAGGSVALVNFIIMDGHDTGGETPIGYDSAKKANAIDVVATDIVKNFWIDKPQYLQGMTQEQIVAIKPGQYN